jgi:tetratricopeptide (TPR) repeat protein
LQQRDYPAALAKLEEAGKRDPKLPGVWSAIATVYWVKGDRETALENIRRQTVETPNLAVAFEGLGRTLLQMQKREEALPALQRWVELAPDDQSGIVTYSAALVAQKKYPQAIDLLAAAAKKHPTVASFSYQLGNAYLESGKDDSALASYKQAVELSSSKAGIENNAAYKLAEKGIYLEHAEEWAREAVRDVEAQTQKLNLGTIESKDLGLMNQLSTDWDTLGWVYFQKGKYALAEPYLRSSWWLRQNAVVGSHLAQVYEKLQQPVQAEHFRQLAQATSDRSGQPRSPLPDTRFKSISKVDQWDPYEQLGKMRTLHVPKVSAKSESAEFFVLFTNSIADHPARTTPEVAASAVSMDASSSHSSTIASAKFINGSDSLRQAGKDLERAELTIHLPPGESAKIIRRGILMCGPYTSGCDFTLLTVDSVHSVN